MKLKLIHLLFSISVPVVFSSCGNNDQTTRHERSPAANNEIIKNQFIRVNQQVAKREDDQMEYYARSHKYPTTRTASGIRYYVYKPSEKGDSIKAGMGITMDYTVTLLDGTFCYSSKTDGRKTFVVEHDNLESGIHKGVQYIKRGDKAVFIIPSPLAHGLLGDFKKIPPQMPIVYNVQVY